MVGLGPPKLLLDGVLDDGLMAAVVILSISRILSSLETQSYANIAPTKLFISHNNESRLNTHLEVESSSYI